MSERLQRIEINGNIIGAKTMHEPLDVLEIELLNQHDGVADAIQQGLLWQNY